MKRSIGIIGYGFVGKAIGLMSPFYEKNVYDPFIEDYSSEVHKIRAYKSDVVFVCVPTNFDEENENLDTSIVESCIQDFYKLNNRGILVIKSTIPVGTIKKLERKDRVLFNPEFLSEATFQDDFLNEKEIYIYSKDKQDYFILTSLYTNFYKSIGNRDVVTYWSNKPEEIELLKIARNTFYAMKVTFSNILYNLCEKNNVEYEEFRKKYSRKEWVGEQHTRVPGKNEKFGYGGKCLPKDARSFLSTLDKDSDEYKMLESMTKFNKKQRNRSK